MSVFLYVYELLVVGGVGVRGADEKLTNVCALDQTATSGRQKEREKDRVTNIQTQRICDTQKCIVYYCITKKKLLSPQIKYHQSVNAIVTNQ